MASPTRNVTTPNLICGNVSRSVASSVQQAVGGQCGADQAVDGTDDHVTEVVHAAVQAGVGDQEGNERAHGDDQAAQPRPLDRGGHDCERGVQGHACTHVTAGVAGRRWGWVQVWHVWAWAAGHQRRGDEDGRLQADRDGRDGSKPPASCAPVHQRDGDQGDSDDDLGVADVRPDRGDRVPRLRPGVLQGPVQVALGVVPALERPGQQLAERADGHPERDARRYRDKENVAHGHAPARPGTAAEVRGNKEHVRSSSQFGSYLRQPVARTATES